MRGNQFYLDGRLYRINYAGDGPPWPLQVWNDGLQVWEAVGAIGTPSSALVMGTTRGALVDDWLALSTAEAIVTSAGEGIMCGTPWIQDLPDWVLLNGDTISVIAQ